MFVLHSRAFKAIAAASVLATATFAPAAFAAVDVYVNAAPPDDRVEIVPAPRNGYVWSPGYWAWRGRHHFWTPGHWERARVGYRWYRDRWDRYGDRWVFYRGHWERD